MENNRPRLDDPEEYALIKSIHFKDDRPNLEAVDPIELSDRQDAKYKHNNKSAR